MNVGFRKLDPESWFWLHERVEPDITKRTKGIVAYDLSSGEILAVTVWDGWTATSAQSHIAIDNPLVIRHGFLEECFGYFFNTCDREIMLATIRSSNHKCLKFLKNVGFTEVFRIEDGFMFGDDLVLVELRKDDCRWIDNGQAGHSRAA